MEAKRGRKKAFNMQSNLLTRYLVCAKQEPQPATVVCDILNDLLQKTVDSSEPEMIVASILHDIVAEAVTLKKRHTGEKVNKSTLDEWQSKYPWLVITTKEGNMKMNCSTCINVKKKLKLTSVWTEDGTPDIQKSSITRHNDSAEHKRACDELEKCAVKQKLLEDISDDEHEIQMTVTKEDEILFNTVYFAAKSEIPTSNVNGLLQLQSANGVSTKYRNLSWGTVTSVQKSISKTLKDELVSEIRESDFFGLVLDESTDVGNEKKLSVCVRYVKDGNPHTKFLCNVPIDDGCAHTIVNCVSTTLEQMGLDISKCTSLATDGASAMMGKKTGAGKQIQSKYAPYCVQTHCVAHRLNLACSDTIKKNEYMVNFRDKFNSLYYFVSASSIRTLTLKKMQEVLEEPQLTIKEPHSIRWLGLKNAVEAVFECYASVIATLSKLAAEKNAVAKGLLKYFNNYKVALVTAFMFDVHSEIASLSCEFQKENLLFSEISPALEGTLSALENLKSDDGRALKKMKDDIIIQNNEASLNGEKMSFSATMNSEFQTLRNNYLKKMQKNIQERLTKKGAELFDDLSKLFEPEKVNEISSEESKEALTHLGSFYGYSKTVKIVQGDLLVGTTEEETEIAPLLDPLQLEQEWPKLEGMIRGSYSGLDTKKLCKRIILVHNKASPNFSILARIALCMQLTSVDCERSFSSQNRLKNKFRAALGSEKLDMLLTISMLGPVFGSYDLQPSIRHWLRKKRRKTRLFAEYKPRSKKLKTC